MLLAIFFWGDILSCTAFHLLCSWICRRLEATESGRVGSDERICGVTWIISEWTCQGFAKFRICRDRFNVMMMMMMMTTTHFDTSQFHDSVMIRCFHSDRLFFLRQASGSSAEPMAEPLTEPLAARIHRNLLPQDDGAKDPRI